MFYKSSYLHFAVKCFYHTGIFAAILGVGVSRYPDGELLVLKASNYSYSFCQLRNSRDLPSIR